MVTYRPTSDGDLMQIHEGKEIGRLGVRLSPDTQDLFAAAPEMLEALKHALSEYEVQLQIEADGNPTVERMRAAINKAEGKKV